MFSFRVNPFLEGNTKQVSIKMYLFLLCGQPMPRLDCVDVGMLLDLRCLYICSEKHICS